MKHKEIILKEIVDKNIFHFNMSNLITIMERKCFKEGSIISIKLSRNLKIIEGWSFYGCTKLKNIDLSKCPRLIEIGYSVFRNCHGLKNIYISNYIRTIGDYAFFNSGISELTIPREVEIGEYGFNNIKINYID